MASAMSPESVLSHWSTLIENFQASPLSFYKAIEEALARRQVPETKRDRVDYREAGMLSAHREYLHITREKLAFDICGAPFGTGFFVSWWLAEDRPHLHPIVKVLALIGMLGFASWLLLSAGMIFGLFLLLLIVTGVLLGVQTMAANGSFDDGILVEVPLLGTLYRWLFKPTTYYRIDTMTMFQKAVHNAVLEVIDTMTAEKGIRALSELERKPVMREFYTRRAA